VGMEFIRIDIMNKAGLAFVLSISLFPYVYVSARAFFLNQANNLLEASKMLGVGERKTFFRLMLPLARPAIIAGLVLVLMEVLNDYGAATYYGVNTFTTGIFRSWFSLGEPQTAVYLSALLILIIFALILFEKWQVRKVKFTSSKADGSHIVRKRPKGAMQWIIFIAVTLPILLGFIIPLAQLVYWAVITASTVFDMKFIMLSLQSFAIAIVSAIITVLFALLLIYFSKWSAISTIKIILHFAVLAYDFHVALIPFVFIIFSLQNFSIAIVSAYITVLFSFIIIFFLKLNANSTIKSISRVGVLGYAIPGAVIAIGIMIPTLALDKWLISVLSSIGVDSG